MTDAAALELRHVRLAEPVTLRPASLGPAPDGGVEEGVFVALDDSPPVRTVLAVVEGERRRALEVVWVVEVAERDDAKAALGAASDDGGAPVVRGFYGRWVADEALERAARVGTEHLEDGTPVVQPVVYDNSVMLDVSDTNMAMPAPVIILDGSDDEDDEDGGGDEDGDEQSAGASGSAEPGYSAAPDDVERQPLRQTIIDPDHAYPEAAAEQAQMVSGGEHQRADAAGVPEPVASEDTIGSDEDAEGADAEDAAETSTDSGEAPSESGDPGESRSKGRKKRKRRR